MVLGAKNGGTPELTSDPENEDHSRDNIPAP
jgi:hypothetical protein